MIIDTRFNIDDEVIVIYKEVYKEYIEKNRTDIENLIDAHHKQYILKEEIDKYESANR